MPYICGMSIFTQEESYSMEINIISIIIALVLIIAALVQQLYKQSLKHDKLHNALRIIERRLTRCRELAGDAYRLPSTQGHTAEGLRYLSEVFENVGADYDSDLRRVDAELTRSLSHLTRENKVVLSKTTFPGEVKVESTREMIINGHYTNEFPVYCTLQQEDTSKPRSASLDAPIAKTASADE